MPRRKHISGRCGGGGAVKLSGMPSAALIHFDARDLVSGSNYDPGTGRVSSWPSRNGSVTMAQATSSKQPLYQAAGFGASPGVLFDGSDDILWSAFGGMASQPTSTVVALKYTGGATDYSQGTFGGSALGAGETDSDDYYKGFGIRGLNPDTTTGFTYFQGPDAGSGYNYRVSTLAPASAGELVVMGGAWSWNGSTNVFSASIRGATGPITGTLNDYNLSATMQSVNLGQYSGNTLEGQLTEVRAWSRALSQVELNRATLIMNGRLA